MVAINPRGVKTFNKNIFLNTPVQTLLFHVFQGWNQRISVQRNTNSTKQGQQPKIFAIIIKKKKKQADATMVEYTPTA